MPSGVVQLGRKALTAALAAGQAGPCAPAHT